MPPSSTSAASATESYALHERVQQLVQRDGALFREPLLKVVAFENLFDGDVRGEPDEAVRAELVHPARVEINDGLFRVEQFEDLRLVCFSVRVYLLARQGAVASSSLPEGSPIKPVKSPIRKMTVWPSS